jgi:hypothetical protein
MQCNTVVKAQAQAQRLSRGRSSCHGPQPHHGTTGHSDPEPHEILATTSNHPLPPHCRPVTGSQHSTAQHSTGAAQSTHTPLALRTTAQEHRGARSRQGEQKLPLFLLPRSRRRLLSSPLSPAPRILHYPPCASLSDPSPLQIPLAYARGPPLPARFRLEARRPGCAFSSCRFVAPRRRRPRRLQAAECSRTGLLPQTSSLFRRWRPPPPSLLCRRPALVVPDLGWSGDPPGLRLLSSSCWYALLTCSE